VVDSSSHTVSVMRLSASCEITFGVAIVILSEFGVVAVSVVLVPGFRRGDCRLGCVGRSIGSIDIGTLFLVMR